MHRRPWRTVLALGLLTPALLGPPASPVSRAEPPSPASSKGQRPIDEYTIEERLALHYRESETVSLVLLPTSVTTRRGRIVRDLDRRDFAVFEDDIPQDIRYFSAEMSEPMSLAFLLDVSGSMRQVGKLRHAKEAIRFFVDTLRAEDRFALVCFADQQVSWVTEFTDDKRRFLQRLLVQEGYGQTALNDAVAATPSLVDEKVTGRKAIVLLTDGVDNHSELSMWEAVKAARRVNVPVYSIGFLSVPEETLPRESRTNLYVLEQIAVETGGRLFKVHDPVELKEAVASIESELRFQYLIGYYPKNRTSDGKFRRVRLEVANDRLDVRTRRGYYAVP